MLRVVIQQLAIFLLPLLLYTAYSLVRQWRARIAGEPVPPWEQGHLFWAIVAGLTLSIGAFLVMEALVTHDPNAIRRPGAPYQ